METSAVESLFSYLTVSTLTIFSLSVPMEFWLDAVAVLSFASALPAWVLRCPQAPSITASPADRIKILVGFIIMIALIFLQRYDFSSEMKNKP